MIRVYSRYMTVGLLFNQTTQETGIMLLIQHFNQIFKRNNNRNFFKKDLQFEICLKTNFKILNNV